MADNKEIIKKKLLERYSPLGVKEYVVPKELENQYFKPGILASTYPDGIYYREEFANNPGIMNHERIHAGQQVLANQPSVEQVAQALGINDIQNEPGGWGRNPAHELPAYAFMGDLNGKKYTESESPFIRKLTRKENEKSQTSANNYLDLVNKLNPDGAQSLEASMPDELIRAYIRNHAKPLAPARQPSMLERSLLDTFLNRK